VRDGQEFDGAAGAVPPQQFEGTRMEHGGRPPIQAGKLSPAPLQILVVAGEIEEFEARGSQDAAELRAQLFRVREGIEQVPAEQEVVRLFPVRGSDQLGEHGQAVFPIGFGQMQIGGVKDAWHGLSGRPGRMPRRRSREYSKGGAAERCDGCGGGPAGGSARRPNDRMIE
jgi:hypothetical protein